MLLFQKHSGLIPHTDGGYSSTILASPADIAQLDEAVSRLMPQRDVSLTPRFFLASLGDNWMPRVVTVSRDGALVGVVYGKERILRGFLTGLIFGDGRLGHLAVAEPRDCEAVTHAAIQSWFTLPRVRGVRLAVAESSSEARALSEMRTSSVVDLTHSAPASTELHCVLPLASDYETFVSRLGHQTRRNFRYYRRKFEAAGHRYVEQIPPDDFGSIAVDLRNMSRIPCSEPSLRRAARTVVSTGTAWISGLQHANGEYLSIAAGWFDQGRATMFLQLNNDLQYADASLSIVLRGYVIETLIKLGVPELIFWSGSAPPLSRYVRPIASVAVHVDARTLGWRLVRGMFGATEPLIERWTGANLRWIAGSAGAYHPLEHDHATSAPETVGPPI